MKKRKKVLIIVAGIVVLLLIAIKVLIGNPIETLRNWNKPMSLPKVEVKLPNQLIRVDFDSITTVSNLKINKTTLLVWIDSIHCMPCKVDMLYNYETLDKNLKTNISDSIQTIAVLSPKSSELEPLIYKLKREQLDFPIYIDCNNEFGNLNSFFLNGIGEVTMCLDRNGIYGLCKTDGPYNSSSDDLFIHILSILHKFNYEGVEIASFGIRTKY